MSPKVSQVVRKPIHPGSSRVLTVLSTPFAKNRSLHSPDNRYARFSQRGGVSALKGWCLLLGGEGGGGGLLLGE